MRAIVGVTSMDSGSVRWSGVPIGPGERRRIGYMPEERGLYPKMRIAEQLVYLAELHGSDPAAALISVDRWLSRFGLADRGRDELQKLSHGNQQRLQLAAAPAFDPVLPMLDEPFAGLDPEAVDAMSEVLHERAGAGTPVIFSSHQLELVERLSDRVGIIRRGHMVAVGSVDELRGRGPERYWVDAPAAEPDWAAQVAGVSVVRRDGSRVLLELAQPGSEQAVLRAALATGPVLEFRRDLPTLLELFREAVAEDRVAAAS